CVFLSSHLIFLPVYSFYSCTASPVIYSLSLHDALPIFSNIDSLEYLLHSSFIRLSPVLSEATCAQRSPMDISGNLILDSINSIRSEEHTSELQSRFDLVCRLLLEKK